MIFYQHLNLPKIPKELLSFDFYEDQPPVIVTRMNDPRFDYGSDHYLDNIYLEPPVYIIKKIHYPPLTEWLSGLFDIPFSVGLSIVEQKNQGRMIIHTDLTNSCVLNYVIDPGGVGVITNWFQESGQSIQRGPKKPGLQTNTGKVYYEDLTLLDSLEAKIDNWYLIRTDVLHDVANLDGARILLQIKFTDFVEPDSFDKLVNRIKF